MTGEREDVDTVRSQWKVNNARRNFETRLSPAGMINSRKIFENEVEVSRERLNFHED